MEHCPIGFTSAETRGFIEGRGRGWIRVILLHATPSAPERLCIQMGSGVRRFTISLIAASESQDSVHKPQLLKGESRRGIEPGSARLPTERLTAGRDRLT